jgi:hypothetical protein
MKNEWGDQLELNQTNSHNQAYNPKQNRAWDCCVFFHINQTKHEKHSKLTRSQDLCHNYNYKFKQRRGKIVTWNKRIQYASMEIVADNREKKWIDYFVSGKEI